MPNFLRGLVVNEISSVDRGAGDGVRVMLMKRDNTEGNTTVKDTEIMKLIEDNTKMQKWFDARKQQGELFEKLLARDEMARKVFGIWHELDKERVAKANAPKVHAEAGNGKPDIYENNAKLQATALAYKKEHGCTMSRALEAVSKSDVFQSAK